MCQKCSHPTTPPTFSLERFSGLWFPLMSSDPPNLIDNCVLSVEAQPGNKLRAKMHIKRKLFDDSQYSNSNPSTASFNGLGGFSQFVILDTDYDKYAIVLNQLCCCCGLIQNSSITIYGRDPKVFEDKLLLLSLFEIIERETKIHRTALKRAYHQEIIQN